MVASIRGVVLSGLALFVVLSGSAAGADQVFARELQAPGVPELPRILSARVVLGTKYGTAVRVSYCFDSLPNDPSTRPWRLHLTVDNLRDGFPPLSVPWEVIKLCATVIHPVGGIQQPYVLRYSVESSGGTRSKQG